VRDTAIAQGRRYKVIINTQQNTIEVYAERVAANAAGATSVAGAANAGPYDVPQFDRVQNSIFSTAHMPTGVILQSAQPATIVFLPSGQADDAVITFCNGDNLITSLQYRGTVGQCVVAS
jgi:hypothetical protein